MLTEDSQISYVRADLQALKSLNELFCEVFDEPDNYHGATPSDEYLKTLLVDKGFIPLAAVTNDAIVGGLAAYVLKKFEQERSEIYIYDLAVREQYWRRGIATGLINKLREIARELGHG